MLGHRRRSVRAFSDSYLVIKDRAVKQGVDSLNQFILIVLEIPSRIAPGLFDVTQETARYVAVGIPAKVNSTESLTAKKINRKMHTYRSCQETWRTCWSLFLPSFPLLVSLSLSIHLSQYLSPSLSLTLIFSGEIEVRVPLFEGFISCFVSALSRDNHHFAQYNFSAAFC